MRKVVIPEVRRALASSSRRPVSPRRAVETSAPNPPRAVETPAPAQPLRGAEAPAPTPPRNLNVQVAMGHERYVSAAVRGIFAPAERWELEAGMAAVYSIRPDLGIEPDPVALRAHLFMFPRDGAYFLRLCELLRLFRIGTEWGRG